MSEWVIPLVCAVLALAGGVYATRGRRASDRGDLADRLWDQVQEGDRTLQEERRRHDRRERAWADYVIKLRRQVEGLGGDPVPYPDDVLRD